MSGSVCRIRRQRPLALQRGGGAYAQSSLFNFGPRAAIKAPHRHEPNNKET
jgi:hypothetical protein